MFTPYSPVLKEFSYRSHAIAKEEFYPKFFKTNDIIWEYPGGQEDELSKLYDSGMNVDVIANVLNPDYRERLKFLIQERFVGRNYLKYGDITITEWNLKTNMPSELHKMTAGYFVYGITDGETVYDRDKHQVKILRLPTTFLGFYIINVADLYLNIIQNNIYSVQRQNPRTKQLFRKFFIKDLNQIGLITWKHTKQQDRPSA